ncbi:MAG: type IV secretion system DNA-binding domain-containing protein [Candidatus Pacebacteria bacterium]|nr:type IV secretion system DNA-binding domain-containing protein [Candidatus Paceibacterota bacterium]
MRSELVLLGFIFVGALIVGAAAFLINKIRRKRYLLKTLELKLLLIKLRKRADKPEKDLWIQEVNLTEQLLGALANIKIPFSLETAVHYIGEEINFYLAIPRESVQLAMRQIQGLWADAQIDEIDDYNIFNSSGVTMTAYLKQKQNSVLPFRTFEEINADTFLPILNNLSKIQAAGEGAAIQVLVKPAPKFFKKNALNSLRSLKKGAKFEDVFKTKLISLKDVKEAFEGQKPPTAQPEKVVLDEEAIKCIEKKLAKPIFSINYRLIVSAPSKFRAEEILNSLASSFDSFEAPFKNGIKAVAPKNQDETIFKFIFRQFDEAQSMILGSDEVSSIFHLPTSITDIPKIKWVKTREAAPPELPQKGTIIGKSIFRGEEKNVYIGDEDRRRHVYTIGQTGTGKSTLIVNMVADDIKAGKGVAVIDPHGDLINSVLETVPEERANDVIIFDPSDLTKPLGLNMLEYDFSKPEEKTFIVNEMQSIFNKLFTQETMGPMFEQYMRNALLLLMEDAQNEPATLAEVPKIFTDSEYRAAKLARCQNPVVKDFWEREAVMVGGEASLQNITPYITSKFNNFIANDYVRPIISQAQSSFKFREVMDSGKILLINLSKGRIGDINANLLGMIIVGKLLMAALSRVDIPQEKRSDFNLYIDEFQNFTTDSISVILSEARKYRLNLVIAHQFIAQLDDKIKDAVFGNVGSIIVFRIGTEDAEFLEKQFAPVFTKEDLMNIDNFNAFAKLLINGQSSKPFNIKTILPPRGNPELRDRIKEISRSKFGLDRSKL